ncbi:MAG: hypothetical protein K0Q76_1835 [Panacagrimonas sp.]|jgi:hypothetical protein|nr:choice-of-anchor P family protein [Panacagrimonas sp.]MCC2656727.1 hypothetical protein [Panacagrimonas sp.]
MKSLSSYAARAVPLLTIAGLMSAVSLPASATGDVFYSGRATGVNASVTVLGIKQNILISDNGMSCQGLPKSETLYSLTNPAPLNVSINEAYTFTQGRERSSLTKARLSGLSVGVPGLAVNSTLIEARAQATCNASNEITLNGKSTIGTLTINGQAYPVTGQPNQRITIPNIASITVNEQQRFANEIRVVGVHVRLLTSNTLATGDLQIAAAKARIVCD